MGELLSCVIEVLEDSEQFGEEAPLDLDFGLIKDRRYKTHSKL